MENLLQGDTVRSCASNAWWSVSRSTLDRVGIRDLEITSVASLALLSCSLVAADLGTVYVSCTVLYSHLWMEFTGSAAA